MRQPQFTGKTGCSKAVVMKSGNSETAKADVDDYDLSLVIDEASVAPA